MTKYTTVALDKYGRYYDLSKEHPSWEQAKKGNELINIVIDAFTVEADKAELLTNKKRK